MVDRKGAEPNAGFNEMNQEQEKWNDIVKNWNDSTRHIPALIQEDIVKSKIDFTTPKRGFTSTFSDPLAVQYSLGYKDRMYSLSYDVMRRVTKQLSIIGAILATRCNQVASFSAPYRNTRSLGFEIRHKHAARLTTKGEREMIRELEEFVSRCGAKEPNPHNLNPRDNFDTFLRKFVRDSMSLDQACAEIVFDRRGLPYEFIAVDAATIRIAAKETPMGPDQTWKHRPPVIDDSRFAQNNFPFPYKMMKLYESDKKKRPDYIQVVNGQIHNTYNRDELIFGVRNPRTDIYMQGYGYSEIEQLITIITAHLNAEEYNRKIFTSGSSPKGILSLKGDNLTNDQLEVFKREWRANMEGVQNAFRTPIIQTEQGVDFIQLSQSNQEMEYGKWMEYLIRVTAALWLVDPEELNFSLSTGGSQTPLFESNNEYKLKASKDKGLKPLLRFIAKLINDSIISKIDDNFVFDFIGLDELSVQEQHELRKDQVTTYKTLNEVRRAEDLPDIEDGDVILNPTYLQAKQIRATAEQQEQQAQQAQSSQAVQVQPGAEAQPQAQQGDQEQKDGSTPQYSDGFSKSLPEGRYLEIDLDSWKVKI